MAITPSGRFTVRAAGSTPAPEGTSVVDRSGTVRGRVLRVFGPVARPYLSVRPRRTPAPAEAVGLLGQPLLRE